MCYNVHTMRRAGNTKTLTVSLGPKSLDVLRRRAKKAYAGNLSAAVAEAAELLERDMAMAELADDLRGTHGQLTDEERRAIDAELNGSPSPKRKRRAA